MAMQALVIAHAAYGHNSFFKGNYLFRMWTDASSIIDYLVYAKNYVAECEERHGARRGRGAARLLPRAAEPRRRPLPPARAASRWRRSCAERKEREAYAQRQVNDLWRTLPQARRQGRGRAEAKRFPEEPQENLLYFIEKNAPLLEPWQREIVRIVRKVAQYFYPQRQTQVMNEGWATFWHHTAAEHDVRRRLPDRRRDDRVAEVAHQRGLPAAGRRIAPTAASTPTRSASRCTPTSSASARSRPTKTAQWFPDIAGTPTGCRRSTTRCATSRTRASSASTCSPKLMREFRLFAIVDDENDERARGQRDPRRGRLPARARGAVAPVRPRLARAEHPGLERQPARRPLADAAPHPAQRPPAARQRRRRC